MTSQEAPKSSPPAQTQEDVEGIDVPRVSAWLAAQLPDLQLPLRFELVAGGRSNLTYVVRDAAGRQLALRRPPLGHVLPTAHDMAREHRILSALKGSAVPVPTPLALCQDPAVNGSPFYVMAFVEGYVLRDAESAVRWLPEAARHRAGLRLAEVLAELHAIDVDAVGLGDLGRREGYVERQLRRWITQFRQSEVPGESLPAVVEEVHERLAARVPEQRATAIVHGDYRLDNAILGPDGEVRAVLDWEICTLGDPRADLGLLMVYWAEPGEPPALVGVSPTTAPGFPSRQELLARYAATSGTEPEDLPYFMAFGYWKLACILQGVHARYAAGAAAGDRSNVSSLGPAVGHLAERALEVLKRP
ncbi:phosphotransferase family protein [Aciditerrimonas ferrireducens]|jgi:aminoglycoside phosphotransferase (APT) family kinase protein|uniref:Phosphotransferase family protein n=1 Tax=Aciditerrimonas ferrireducens TaxID=667306 RepID=A0ABV6C3X9_9ACTN|nr:phosphotransferase family protein [Aciditerrimonas ferrireducens]MCK4176510.1 phosphotransferase family protein [Aciditerrimonas ferrireducens]